MRVLIVSKLNTRESYGGSSRAYHLGRHLAEKADVMHVGPRCEGAGVERFLSTGTTGLRRLAAGVRRAVRAFQPDVVLGMELRAALVSRLALGRQAARRLVVCYDSSPAHEWTAYQGSPEIPRLKARARAGVSRVIERVVLSGRGPVIVVSEFLRRLIQDDYRVDPRRIWVVPNGAPPDMLERPFSPGPSPYGPDGAGRADVLLVAPRNYYSNVAAVRLAHQVAERLEARAPRVRLAIVGGGPELGQGPNVRYFGYVPDVVPFIDFAALGILPYPPWGVCGGARLKAMEYLARGKPVLTTREGIAGADTVRPDVEVALGPDDPDGFARAMVDVLEDPERLARLGQAGRRLVRERHDWRTLAWDVLHRLEGWHR